MFYSTLLVAAAAFTGLASAQNSSSSATPADPNGYNPNAIEVYPNSVDYDTRVSWCRAQTNSCPELCGGQAFPNNCDSNTLNYTCTCTGGMTPNISDYSQTLPSLMCERWKADCIAAHPNDLTGQNQCLDVTCGQRNASAAGDSDSSSSSMSASATASSSATGGSGGAMASSTASSTSGSDSDSSASATSSDSAASASSSSSAAIALSVAQTYGTGMLAAGMLAFFGLAL